MDTVPLRTVPSGEGDFALARRVVAGDMNAFAQIMRRHNRMLYRTARSILRDDGEAEDCLQSAYLSAYRCIASFAGNSKLSTWLARIVINEALGRLRQRARHGAAISLDAAPIEDHSVVDLTSDGPGPGQEAMRRELGALIERRIDALPEVFRRVFVLRAIEEMSVEETADLLDVPEATVRTRYFRARSLLRESLERDVDTALDGAFGFVGARCARIVADVLERIGGPSAA